MKICITCKNAIIDERWGEYKCSEKQTIIRDLRDINPCNLYEKGVPKLSKKYKGEEKE